MRPSLRAASLLLLALLLGCGNKGGINKGGAISGSVTIDGKPVTAGTVLLIGPDDVRSVSGFINEYGKYTVKEPPLGLCKVAILTKDKVGSVRPKTGKDGKGGSGSAGMVIPSPEEMGMTYVPIPEKYESAATSGLTVEVIPGNQEHDLPLTKK